MDKDHFDLLCTVLCIELLFGNRDSVRTVMYVILRDTDPAGKKIKQNVIAYQKI